MRELLGGCLAAVLVTVPGIAATGSDVASLFNALIGISQPSTTTSVVGGVSSTSPFAGFNQVGSPTDYLGNTTAISTAPVYSPQSFSTTPVYSPQSFNFAAFFSQPTTAPSMPVVSLPGMPGGSGYGTGSSLPYSTPGSFASFFEQMQSGRISAPLPSTVPLFGAPPPVDPLANPEPSTVLLVVGGLGVLAALKRRSMRRS